MATGTLVSYRVPEPEGERNRLTVAFRPILAIPHLLFVGGPGVGVGTSGARTGVLGIVAVVGAVINWFAIVITGRPVEKLFDLQVMYLRWRANALTYETMLRDEYPPFGEGAYPTESGFQPIIGERPRVSVAFRLILAIPHLIVFTLVLLVWFVTAVIGWFAVLFTGSYPHGLWRFAEGVNRWDLRLESYLLLIHDEYPPFSLE